MMKTNFVKILLKFAKIESNKDHKNLLLSFISICI